MPRRRPLKPAFIFDGMKFTITPRGSRYLGRYATVAGDFAKCGIFTWIVVNQAMKIELPEHLTTPRDEEYLHNANLLSVPVWILSS